MRAEDIKDAESLQAWLESLPQETEEDRETARRWAVTIAHRAAMRVLPVYWEWSLSDSARHLGPTALQLLRPCLISVRAAVSLTPIIEFVAAHAANSVNAYPAYAALARAASCAALNAGAATGSTAANAANAFADAGFSTVAARSGLAVYWDELGADCTRLERNRAIASGPLWRRQNPLEQVWIGLRPQILAQGDGWRFWVEWYENALYGRPQDYDLLTKIALIDPADWDKGADHVNALIAQIRLGHIAETRLLGEDAIDIGPDGLWHRTGKSDIDGDILQDAVASVQDEIASLRTKLQGPQGNMFTALVSDLDLLEQRIARHPGRPLRLHDLFIRVQGHIARNLQSGELPDDDCVRDLSSVLGNAALDMCNACDKTKSVVQKRMAVRFDDADEQTRDDLKTIAEGAARISDAELAEEIKASATEVADPSIPIEEKTGAIYRLQTWLAKMALHGKNLIDALKEIGAIKAGVDAFVWITMTLLRFIIGP